MSITWQLKLPKKIIFESNSIEKTGGILKDLFDGRALVITDRVMKETGILNKLESSLKGRSVSFEVFDGVSSEPYDTYVKEGLKIFNEKDCRGIIALGGGSPIDTAKAVSVMTSNPGKISDYMGLDNIRKKGAPLIAIPTTGGTGSEVTSATIITDEFTNVKMLFISEHLIPDLAIVDPTLTLSCPPHLTTAVGIDALTHAIEAYVSKKANLVTDLVALKAIRLIYRNIKKVYKNGNDLKAREKVMMGATLAGMAFSNSSVALVHGMSRPIGANLHVPHGVSNAALLKVVMDFSYTSSTMRYANIAEVMREDISQINKEDAARMAVELVSELIHDLDIPSLRKLGIKKDRLKELAPFMAKAAIESGSPNNNPRIATEDEIIKLYLKAY